MYIDMYVYIVYLYYRLGESELHSRNRCVYGFKYMLGLRGFYIRRVLYLECVRDS